MTLWPWIHSWLFGALTGFTLLSLVYFSPFVFPVAITALVVVVVRSSERAALGGGALVTTGVLFLYGLRGAIERCAEIDRSPTGSCSIYGVEEQAIAMSLYLAVGVGLTLYAAFRHRPGASGGPSAAVPRRR